MRFEVKHVFIRSNCAEIIGEHFGASVGFRVQREQINRKADSLPANDISIEFEIIPKFG